MTKTRQLRQHILAIFIVSLVVFLSGCSSGTNVLRYNQVRFANGLVGVGTPPTVDMVSNTTIVAANVPIGGVSSYQATTTSVASIGVNQSQTQASIIPATPAVLEGDDLASRTVVAMGVRGRTDTLGPKLMVLYDRFVTADATKSLVGIRLVNLSPDSAPIDLYSANAPVLGATNISYGNSSDYVLMTAGGALNLRDTATGNVLSAPFLARGPILTAGKNYTLFVIGVVSPANASQESQDARITLDN